MAAMTAILLAAACAHAQGVLMQLPPVTDSMGHPIAGATVSVFTASGTLPNLACNTPVTVYKDVALIVPFTTLTTDGFGNFPFFIQPNTNPYGYTVSAAGTNTSICYGFSAQIGPTTSPTYTTVTFLASGKFTETTAPACLAGFDFLWGSSVSHRLLECDNGGAAVQLAHSGADINTSDQVTATHLASPLPIAQGGCNATTAAGCFNNISPMTTLGDLEYESGANTAARLAGNITATKQYLSQTGTGVVSAAPVWAQIAAADLSDGNTGTGALVHATGAAIGTPTVTSPTINTGVAQGSGVKHQRFGATCTTAAAIGASCTTTETWTVTFADANYTVSCTGVTSVNAPAGISVEGITAANFVVRIFALTATASGYSGVDCIAFHD